MNICRQKKTQPICRFLKKLIQNVAYPAHNRIVRSSPLLWYKAAQHALFDIHCPLSTVHYPSSSTSNCISCCSDMHGMRETRSQSDDQAQLLDSLALLLGNLECVLGFFLQGSRCAESLTSFRRRFRRGGKNSRLDSWLLACLWRRVCVLLLLVYSIFKAKGKAS